MASRIYFAGSIRGGRDDAALYQKIVKILQRFGTVLTEHVGDIGLVETGEAQLTEKEIHDRDIAWLKSCDVLIAEVTQPSLGVGYEIGKAIDMQKQILCMYRPSSGKRLSAMIRGAENNSSFKVIDYKEEDAEKILERYFNNKS